MSDYRPLCLPCHSRMKEINNTITLPEGEGYQWATLYECPKCGHRTLSDFTGISTISTLVGIGVDPERARELIKTRREYALP